MYVVTCFSVSDKSELTKKSSPKVNSVRACRSSNNSLASGVDPGGGESSSGYSKRLLANLNNLRSSPQNNLCDVEIVPGLDQGGKHGHHGEVFYAHR